MVISEGQKGMTRGLATYEDKEKCEKWTCTEELMLGSPCLKPTLEDYTQQSANGHRRTEWRGVQETESIRWPLSPSSPLPPPHQRPSLPQSRPCWKHFPLSHSQPPSSTRCLLPHHLKCSVAFYLCPSRWTRLSWWTLENSCSHNSHQSLGCRWKPWLER